jgi:uncharacterized membrane protein HdeD (DUF308 family)
MASPRPGVGSAPNYFREAFPDFEPGDGPLVNDLVKALLPGGTVQALTAAGAISLDTAVTTIVGPAASTYAVTLAVPSRAGQVKVIQMLSTTSTNAVTLTLTNVIGGSAATTATFNAANETLVLVSAVGKWVVVAEAGVTLS